MASWTGSPGTLASARRPSDASGDWTGTRRRSRAVSPFNSGSKTQRRPRMAGSPRSRSSTRSIWMSAAELLHGLQPACASSARCKPAAMGQCARGRQWWCRRDAPAHRHRHRQTRHVHLLWSRRIAHRSRQPAQPSPTRLDDMVLPHLCCRNTNSFDRGDREPQDSTVYVPR